MTRGLPPNAPSRNRSRGGWDFDLAARAKTGCVGGHAIGEAVVDHDRFERGQCLGADARDRASSKRLALKTGMTTLTSGVDGAPDR
jgi:hypothetical protein